MSGVDGAWPDPITGIGAVFDRDETTGVLLVPTAPASAPATWAFTSEASKVPIIVR